MGLFSIFKTPVNETLGVICSAYNKKLDSSGDSKQAFVEMAKEAFNQLRQHKRVNFSSPVDTYGMLSGKEFSELSASHKDNREHLQYYLFNMMMYIRSDYFKPPDHQKNERLKVMIDMNLR
jgi:hypothetical protein